MAHSLDSGYDASVGRRIQAIRKQRGLTQHGLAQRADLSYSCITKVESGHRAATPTVMAACARALRVPVTDLTGQPYFDRLKADQLEELVQPVRAAIANPMLPPADLPPVRSLAQMTAEIRTLEESRLRGEHMAIGTQAPALIDALLAAVDSAPAGIERERTYYALAMTYRLVRSFTHKLGFMDLGLLALDRMERAVAQSGDPYLGVVVCHYRSDYFLHHGAYEVALREIAAVDRYLESAVSRGEQRALSASGTLHLKSAVLHSRMRTSSSAAMRRDHITEAGELARRTVGLSDPYGMIFDPVNVAIHAVSTRIDLGDVGEAVEEGARLRAPSGWALNRQSHHHMDMARAYERLGQRDRALEALTTARDAAPAQTRYHPTTRETVLAMLRGRGTPAPELRRYARWVGV